MSSSTPSCAQVSITLGAYIGINAGLGAASLAVFTSINPGLGALFGVVHTVVSVATIFLLECCIDLPKDSTALAFTATTLLSSVLTTALAAGLLAIMGVPLTVVIIGAIFVSLLISALATSTVCCASSKDN